MSRLGLLLPVLTLAILVHCPPARGEEFYSQEKCSLCHIRQSVFFSPGFATPEVLKGFGEERVCYSCHDGTVRDHRAVLWRGAQHPAVAPGDREGAKRCSACHSPHSKGGWAVLAGTSIPIRTGGDAVCAKCHPGRERAEGRLHGKGFPNGGCAECHRAHGGTGTALLREARGALCLRCHPDADAGKAGGHPVARSASSPGAGKPLPECLTCHPVHGSGSRAGVIDSQCAGCHRFGKRSAAPGERAHPAEGTCTACHSFHTKTAKGGKGLRRADIRTDLLCGGCHAEKIADGRSRGREKGTHPSRSSEGGKDLCLRCHRVHQGAAGTTLLASAKAYSCLECHEGQNTISEIAGLVLAHPVFERVEKGRLAQLARTRRLPLGPAGEIVCRTCHAVHRASPDTPLLAPGTAGEGSCLICHEGKSGRSHLASGKAAIGPACGTCHPVHGMRASAGAADPWTGLCAACHARASSHGPGSSAGGAGRPSDLPGFDGRGRKIRTGVISCPTCHDPHGMPVDKRLRRPYAATGFVCTACHQDKETVALTPHDLRGISGKSICEPCHAPHGGKTPWMWGLATDEAEGGGAACRSCHRDNGLAKPVARGGHPVNVPSSRPVPGLFPLFGPGGDKTRTGMVTCATCHEVHGTGFVPFGQGTGMLLRASAGQAAEDIGRVRTCLPCHQGKQGQHGQADCIWCHPPHEDKGAGPDCRACHSMGDKGIARNHAEKRQGCGACHRIHAAKAGESAAGACVGCHAKNGRIVGTPHAEMGEGPCRGCHPAHADLEDTPMKRHGWEDVFAPDFACLRCHREGGTGPAVAAGDHPKSRKTVPTSYGATVTIETPITILGRLQEGGKPLFPFFDESGKKGLSGRMGCLTCHDPHSGAKMKNDDDKQSGARYLRDPSGVFLAEICAPCHKDASGEHARRFHDVPRKTD